MTQECQGLHSQYWWLFNQRLLLTFWIGHIRRATLYQSTHRSFLKCIQQGCLSSETTVPEPQSDPQSSQLPHWSSYLVSLVLTCPTGKWGRKRITSLIWEGNGRQCTHTLQSLPNIIHGNPFLLSVSKQAAQEVLVDFHISACSVFSSS